MAHPPRQSPTRYQESHHLATARLALLLALLGWTAGGELSARIVSYAPVTNRHAVPAVQHRLNRHYALIESDSPVQAFLPPIPSRPAACLVLYDAAGEEEPRVVFPGDGSDVRILAAAVWEGGDEIPRLLISTDANLSGDNPTRLMRFLYSGDAGSHWKPLGIPPGDSLGYRLASDDVGGPVAGHRGSQVRIGSAENPFALLVSTPFGGRVLYLVASDGTARSLATFSPGSEAQLIGADRAGTRFLVAETPDGSSVRRLRILRFDGGSEPVGEAPGAYSLLEGWIAADGSVYVEERLSAVWLFRGGVRQTVATAPPFQQGPCPLWCPPYYQTFFTVPTADFSGAWIVTRLPGQFAVLASHAPGGPLVEHWRDTSDPQIEAIHAGSSGRRLLIQVHRPRPQADQRIFVDPALALWEVGQPPPTSYDELFLNEGFSKAFIHLDVEQIEHGEPFVFDSAATATPFFVGPLPSPAPPGPGGGDVTQEWGVVRASLRQRLVLPIAIRAPGAYGSLWRTDLVLRNPSSRPVRVSLLYADVASIDAPPVGITLELSPEEIRVMTDVLGTVMGVEKGSGVLALVPERGTAVSATSRTYTVSALGSYGMGVPAVETTVASSARFPVSFAAALQGSGFRTNLVSTDAAGRGARVSVRAPEVAGRGRGPREFSFFTPPGGQSLLGGLASLLGVAPEQNGALLFEPLDGEAIPALVVADNSTNDPSYFAPDLPSSVVRTIPAIISADGAHGSRWRTDLFLFNPSPEHRTITLAARRWDDAANEKIRQITLSPFESQTVRDALPSLFDLTGVARLRYVSGNLSDTSGVRVTARIFTMDTAGGTFGYSAPPLNAFQAAGAGDSLEILGARGEAGFRTNLALVDLAAFPTGPAAKAIVEIYDQAGRELDRFEVTVPAAGGVQISDLFRSRSLGDGPRAALLRVSPSSGILGAFATLTDNATNDPVYLPAALASK